MIDLTEILAESGKKIAKQVKLGEKIIAKSSEKITNVVKNRIYKINKPIKKSIEICSKKFKLEVLIEEGDNYQKYKIGESEKVVKVIKNDEKYNHSLFREILCHQLVSPSIQVSTLFGVHLDSYSDSCFLLLDFGLSLSDILSQRSDSGIPLSQDEILNVFV